MVCYCRDLTRHPAGYCPACLTPNELAVKVVHEMRAMVCFLQILSPICLLNNVLRASLTPQPLASHGLLYITYAGHLFSASPLSLRFFCSAIHPDHICITIVHAGFPYFPAHFRYAFSSRRFVPGPPTFSLCLFPPPFDYHLLRIVVSFCDCQSHGPLLGPYITFRIKIMPLLRYSLLHISPALLSSLVTSLHN